MPAGRNVGVIIVYFVVQHAKIVNDLSNKRICPGRYAIKHGKTNPSGEITNDRKAEVDMWQFPYLKNHVRLAAALFVLENENGQDCSAQCLKKKAKKNIFLSQLSPFPPQHIDGLVQHYPKCLYFV